MNDSDPRITEVDFQREKLRRDLVEVVSMLEEAASEQDAEERRIADVRVAFCLAAFTFMPYTEAAAFAIDPVATEQSRARRERNGK